MIQAVLVGKWKVASITIEGLTRQVKRGPVFHIAETGLVKHAVDNGGTWNEIQGCAVINEDNKQIIWNPTGVAYQIDSISQHIINLTSNNGYFRYEARRVAG